jgi:hypothetical protein
MTAARLRRPVLVVSFVALRNLELEHGVEASMHADERRNVADREQRAVDVGTCAAAGIMTDR